jgi:hypothetical protein
VVCPPDAFLRVYTEDWGGEYGWRVEVAEDGFKIARLRAFLRM